MVTVDSLHLKRLAGISMLGRSGVRPVARPLLSGVSDAFTARRSSCWLPWPSSAPSRVHARGTFKAWAAHGGADLVGVAIRPAEVQTYCDLSTLLEVWWAVLFDQPYFCLLGSRRVAARRQRKERWGRRSRACYPGELLAGRVNARLQPLGQAKPEAVLAGVRVL